MPIYEYRCTLCGQEHEVLQKASEPPLLDCPACGKPGLQKLLTAAGFQLKGSGWYATDFKGNGKKKAEEKKPEKKDAKTESKTETKPKPETKSEAPA
jgi:putative FmdB family regulatory protein